MNNQDNRPPMLLPLIGIGVAIGWLLRKALQHEYETQDGSRQGRVSDREMLETVFGGYSKQAQEYLDDAREAIDDQIEDLQTTWEDIDKDKYMDLVKDVVADLQDDGHIDARQAHKLSTYLMKDWRSVRGEAAGKIRSARRATNAEVRQISSRANSIAKDIKDKTKK